MGDYTADDDIDDDKIEIEDSQELKAAKKEIETAVIKMDEVYNLLYTDQFMASLQSDISDKGQVNERAHYQIMRKLANLVNVRERLTVKEKLDGLQKAFGKNSSTPIRNRHLLYLKDDGVISNNGILTERCMNLANNSATLLLAISSIRPFRVSSKSKHSTPKLTSREADVIYASLSRVNRNDKNDKHKLSTIVKELERHIEPYKSVVHSLNRLRSTRSTVMNDMLGFKKRRVELTAEENRQTYALNNSRRILNKLRDHRDRRSNLYEKKTGRIETMIENKEAAEDHHSALLASIRSDIDNCTSKIIEAEEQLVIIDNSIDRIRKDLQPIALELTEDLEYYLGIKVVKKYMLRLTNKSVW